MININAANHSRLIKERHVVHCPRLATNFRTDLNKNLVANASDVLASANRVGQDYLRRYRDLLDEKSL